MNRTLPKKRKNIIMINLIIKYCKMFIPARGNLYYSIIIVFIFNKLTFTDG